MSEIVDKLLEPKELEGTEGTPVLPVDADLQLSTLVQIDGESRFDLNDRTIPNKKYTFGPTPVANTFSSSSAQPSGCPASKQP